MLVCRDHMGRSVVLLERIWTQKILAKHPRVEAFIDVEIPRAISSPDFVNFDKDFPERVCHYLRLTKNSRGLERLLKVVIEYTSDNTDEGLEVGRIVSIYVASRVPGSEVRGWP